MKTAMVNCYVHADQPARWTCVLCGNGICSKCSNWVAENVYMCPNCWEETSPTSMRPGLQRISKALYVAAAFGVVIVGAWYVFAILTPPHTPPQTFAPPYP